METDFFDDRFYEQTFQEGVFVLYHGKDLNLPGFLEIVNPGDDLLAWVIVEGMCSVTDQATEIFLIVLLLFS